MLHANVPQQQAMRIASEAMQSTSSKHQVRSAADALNDMSFSAAVRTHLSVIDSKLERLAKQSSAGLADIGNAWYRNGDDITLTGRDNRR